MAGQQFPALAFLEALLAWQRLPDADHHGRVADALGVLTADVGVVGVRLEAPGIGPLALAVEHGTFQSAPGNREGQRLTLDLYAAGRDEPIGSLRLLALTEDVTATVRAIELAVEAAWSREEVRQTARRLEALDAATRGIAGLVALDRVLQQIVDRVRELIGAEYAALGIVDERGLMERFVTSGISRAARDRIGPLPRGHGLLGLIVRENLSYRVPDISRHADSSGFPAHHPPMQSFLGVPIQVKGRSVGNFYLTNKMQEREFSEADQRLVEMFALHAGVAIENARLHEQVHQLAVVDERARIGKDLHDGIIQVLYGVGLSLEDVPALMHEDPAEAVARVDRAIDSLNLTIRDIRNFIFGLQPELVAQGGLIAGLATLANEFRLNTMIDVEFEAGDGVPDIEPERRAELLQIAREALSNIARHSRASSARVVLAADGDHLQLVISDNGAGFAPDQTRDDGHLGLANMHTRATDLGGRLQIDSEVGAGTRIIAWLPYTTPAPGQHARVE